MATQPDIKKLEEQGYKREDGVLKSPPKTYIKDWDQDPNFRHSGTYSAHVLYIDSQGRVTKEVRQRPMITEESSTGAWRQQRVRATEIKNYDYEKGQVSIRTPANNITTFRQIAQAEKGRTPKRIQQEVLSQETKTIAGKEVTIKTLKQPTYLSVQKEREAYLQAKITKAPEKKKVYIALEKGGAEKINKQLAEAGIKTAGDFFKAVKSEYAPAQDGTIYAPVSEQQSRAEDFIIKLQEREKALIEREEGAKDFFRTHLEGPSNVFFEWVKKYPGVKQITEAYPLQTGQTEEWLKEYQAYFLSAPARYTFGLGGGIALAGDKIAVMNEIAKIDRAKATATQQEYYNAFSKERLRDPLLRSLDPRTPSGAVNLMFLAGAPYLKARAKFVEARGTRAVTYERMSGRYDYIAEPLEWSAEARVKGGAKFQPADPRLGMAKAPELQTQLQYPKVDPLYLRRQGYEPLDRSIFAPETYVPEFHLKQARGIGQTGLEVYQDVEVRLQKGGRLKAVLEEDALSRAIQKNKALKEAQFKEVAEEQARTSGERQIFLDEYKPDTEVIFIEEPTGETRAFFVKMNKKAQASLTTQKFDKVYDRPAFYVENLKAKFSPGALEVAPGKTPPGPTLKPINLNVRSYELGTALSGEYKPFTEIKSITLGEFQIDRAKAFSKIELDTTPKAIQYAGVESIQRQSPAYRQIAITQPDQEIELITEQTTPQRPAVEYRPVYFPPVRFQTHKPPTPPRFRPPLIPPRIKPPSKKPAETPGFDVFLRRRGEFKKVSALPLSKAEAISLGSFKAEHTAGATFKITPAPGPAKGRFFGKGPSLKRFYEKEGAYIEKSKHRISTAGELSEITFKGISTKKSKKLFKKRKKENPFSFGFKNIFGA